MEANSKRDPFVDRLISHAKAGTFGATEDPQQVTIKQGNSVRQVEAFFPTGNSTLLYAGSFNGEKNLGEMGPVKYYLMDYTALSLRSWQAYLESAEAHTVINKYCSWVISGKGLKLQSEPIKRLLEKSNPDLKEFSNDVEARWQVYSNSKRADHSGRKTLNQLARVAFKNSIIGGDVLVLLRYVDDCITVQLVDGMHVQSPLMGSEWWPAILESGNRVINGIEINKKGQQVAYYVRKPYDSLNPLNTLMYDRIQAKGRDSGIFQAFMVYGLEYRLDTHRGIPLLTAVLEKLKKLERYEEATLGAAEEQAKIAYQIVHEMGSTGEFPFTTRVAAARDVGYGSTEDLPANDLGQDLANKVVATTGKTIVNNPNGAEIKPMRDTKSQLYYKDFRAANFDIICATVEMPPDVAKSQFNGSYSASRAAVKDWEHILANVKRPDFASQFYQNIYNFFLRIEIWRNNIQAPGYLIALSKDDYMMIEAYQTARWVGAPVANIDPVKEVQAERLKLGITAESIPLTTVEAATELLAGGDSEHNMESYSDELEYSKILGLKPEPEVKQQAVVTDK